MLYFVDTSAFAKRYIPENGSDWVKSWIQPEEKNDIAISQISKIEFISLLARRQREGNVSESDFSKLRADFLTHCVTGYLVVTLNTQIIKIAQQLITKHPLRTLDAIQLGMAILINNVIGLRPLFISGDLRLLEVAKAEGFKTDSPLNHL